MNSLIPLMMQTGLGLGFWSLIACNLCKAHCCVYRATKVLYPVWHAAQSLIQVMQSKEIPFQQNTETKNLCVFLKHSLLLNLNHVPFYDNLNDILVHNPVLQCLSTIALLCVRVELLSNAANSCLQRYCKQFLETPVRLQVLSLLSLCCAHVK